MIYLYISLDMECINVVTGPWVRPGASFVNVRFVFRIKFTLNLVNYLYISVATCRLSIINGS